MHPFYILLCMLCECVLHIAKWLLVIVSWENLHPQLLFQLFHSILGHFRHATFSSIVIHSKTFGGEVLDSITVLSLHLIDQQIF